MRNSETCTHLLQASWLFLCMQTNSSFLPLSHVEQRRVAMVVSSYFNVSILSIQPQSVSTINDIRCTDNQELLHHTNSICDTARDVMSSRDSSVRGQALRRDAAVAGGSHQTVLKQLPQCRVVDSSLDLHVAIQSVA